EALKIFRELKIPRYIATNLNNIGKVCDSLGQYDKALSYYEEALKVDRELNAPQGIATSLNNIGTVYKSLGQYDKALSYYEEALRICRELNIPRDIATSLSNIGFVYLFQKRYKDAENKFIESKKEREKTGGIEWKGEPGLVDVYLATDRYEEALKLLEKMGPEWNAHDPYRIQFHTQNGLALKGIGLLKEASQEFLKAVSISEGMRQKVKEKAGFFGAGYGGGRIRSYRGLFVTLSERAIKGEKIDDEFILYGKDLVSNAFYFSEATKARALLEAMAESAKRYARTELPSEIREKEEDILNQLSAIENRWDETYKKGETAFKELLERKEKLKKELDTFISKTRKEYPIYAALHYPKPIPPEELPLKDDEVLLEYAIGDNTIYLFIVRKGGVKNLIKIPTSRETLEEKVMAFMEPLNTGQYHKFSVKIAKELYDILLSEAVKEIKETEKIIIVPDGILGLLPFEALMIKPEEDYKDSLYVGDRCSITYAQSATTLALTRMLKPSQTEKPLFALGNPIYNKEDPRYVAYKQGKTEQTLFAMDSERYVYRGITIIPKQDKTDKEKINWEEVVYSPLPETEDEVRAIAKTFNLEPKPPDVLLNI
ncbi:MAG: tetratricopeptide repeat protein, partial [Nitrospirota bacterium]